MSAAAILSPKREAIGSRINRPTRAARIPLGPCVAASLAAAYFARASLIAYIGAQGTIQLVSDLAIAALIASCAYVAAGGVTQFHLRGVLMIGAGAASLWKCETLEFALTRWAGWGLMLIAVGPVLATPVAQRFRRAAMEAVSAGLVVATLSSSAWWLLGLPNLGRGDFTGVMWHSMMLGPIAAMAGLIALSRSTTGGPSVWYGIFIASVGLTFLAASRSALAGLILGATVLFTMKLKRRPLLVLFMVGTGLVVALSPDEPLALISRVAPDSLTSGLMRKSFEHTREGHWAARWEEFLDSPLTGVGFACGWEGAEGYNEETGAIETGSSYLSILSMTGALGAAAFLLLVGSATSGAIRHWRRVSERTRLESAALAAFWTVHLGAEGYIYGVGSLMGLIFWLWLARVFDQFEAAQRG